MATLLDQYSENNTVRTQILSVESAPNFWEFPILKSTEPLPEGLTLTDEEGNPLGDVRTGKDGALYAPIQTFITTLEQVKNNKKGSFEQSAISEATEIRKDVLEENGSITERIQAVVVKRDVKIAEVELAVTIQDAESIVWSLV